MSDLAWCSCLIIGVIIFLIGIIFFFAKRKNKTNTVIATLFEFVAYSVLLFPPVFESIPDSGLRGIETFFSSILITFTHYLGEGYDRFEVAEHLPVWFYSAYCIVMVLANLLILCFAADFILQLAEGPYQLLRLKFHSKKTIFVFSECNEKTIAIADSLKDSPDVKGFGDFRIVFSVTDKQDTSPYSKVLDNMGAIILNEDVESIFNRINGKSARIEVFLFNEKEVQNLNEMGRICSSDNIPSIVRVYVETNRTHWSLYDDYIKTVTAEKENLTINLVRTEENFIYNLLLKYSIFENAQPKNSSKLIKVVIVGYNYRNVEFLKAVLHLSQMPGYELKVALIDDGDHRNELKHIMPEISERGGGYGDSIYEFRCFTNIDYMSSDFDDLIRNELKDFTYAFINAGDDLLNSDIAISLNLLCIREGNKKPGSILVNVTDKNVCCEDKWNSGLINGISFVGDISEVYAYDFITMSLIEEATKKIHYVRQEENAAKDSGYKIKTWKEYCNNEYNRHSVYARTLSFAFKVKIIGESLKDNDDDSIYAVTNSSREWKVYEHMRWNVYTRTLGFVKAPDYLLNEKKEVGRDIRNSAKVHHCLVPFDELPAKEQEKDSLTLTPEIVEILKQSIK